MNIYDALKEIEESNDPEDWIDMLYDALFEDINKLRKYELACNIAEKLHHKWCVNRNYAARLKFIDDEWINITIPFSNLPDVIKNENITAALHAINVYESGITYPLLMASLIHEAWVARNRATASADQLVGWNELHPIEQLKDVEIANVVIKEIQS